MDTIFPIITNKEENLPMHVKGIGTQQNQEHIKRPEGFYCYHLACCSSGKGIFLIDNKKYTITPGMYFFFYPDISHEYYSIEEPWSTDWIIFHGNFCDTILKSLSINSYETGAVNTKIVNLMNSIYMGLISSNSISSIECSSLLYNLLIELGRHKAKNSYHTSSIKNDKLLKLTSYIEANYNHDLTLEQMSNHIGITQYYLCRLFKNQLNISPFTYLTLLRLKKAKELLIQSPGMKIKKVSSMCGFNSASYFCSVFKKYESITPEEFRVRYGISS